MATLAPASVAHEVLENRKGDDGDAASAPRSRALEPPLPANGQRRALAGLASLERIDTTTQRAPASNHP